jgi:tetratricopeptide (TPR) repeat protein
LSSAKTKLLDSAQKNLLKGQFTRAVADYRQIIQIDPSDMRHRQKLAEILTKDNQRDEAVSEYTSLAKHYIDSVHYLKAIAVYKQIQKLEPTNAEISLTLGSLNEKQGLIGNATAEYAAALHIYETNGENLKGLKVLESMLALDPGNSAVRLRIAEKNFAVGKESDSFNGFVALATDLKNRNDENGFMHISERIQQIFKERAQEIFSLIGGEEEAEAEDNSPDAPTFPEPESEPEEIASPPLQAAAVQEDQPVTLIEKTPETPPSFFPIDSEEPLEDIPLMEELEEMEDVEEDSVETDEPDWEEDIELDLTSGEQLSDDALIYDAEEYEEPEPELELEELELDDVELVLEDEELVLDDEELALEDEELVLEDEGLVLENEELAPEDEELVLEDEELVLENEELDTEPLPSQPDTSSHQDSEFTESPFDLGGELSAFADEIDFDLIKTSSDSQFTLDTGSGFKRNELDNEDAESHYSLGLAYKEMGLFDEAISEFLVASRSVERKIDSLILQGVCFRELGNTEKAVEILTDTLNLPDINDDELLGVKYELAICREVLGEKPLARQLYAEIITVRPDFSDTASRMEAL